MDPPTQQHSSVAQMQTPETHAREMALRMGGVGSSASSQAAMLAARQARVRGDPSAMLQQMQQFQQQQQQMQMPPAVAPGKLSPTEFQALAARQTSSTPPLPPQPLMPSSQAHAQALENKRAHQMVQMAQQQQQQQQQQQMLLPDAAALARMDPKMRKEAKRQQEIQQREAELLQARKAYFQVRKQAEAKKWHMIHGETNTAPAGAINEGAANHGGYQGMPAHHHSRSEGDDNSSRQPHSIQQGSYAAWQGNNGDGDNAAAEFEEELQRGGDFGRGGGGRAGAHANPMLLNVLGSTGGGVKAEGLAAGASPPTPTPAQRAAAVRELCVSALGPVLFEMLYDAMRQRLGGTADDAYFHRELQARLGSHHMQYVHLVDQLLYLEELGGLRS